jgi:long-chain acyl-CoA synthetase
MSKLLGIEGENIRDIDISRVQKIWIKYYDDGVPHTIDYPLIPVHQLLDNAAARVPDNPAAIFFGNTITYKQVADASDKVAAFLYDIGVEKGERIVVSLPTTPHYAMITAGISKVGGVVVQCNPLYTTRELRYLFENSEATRMFCLDLIYPNVRPLIEDGIVDKVVICSIQDFMEGVTPQIPEERKEVIPWSEVLRYERTDKRAEINPKEDVAMFQYTGGTTGVPKGVMLTHYNLVVNAYQSAYWDPKASPNDVGIGVLPVFHVYGMTMGNAAAIIGMKTVPIPDPRNWDLLLATIHNYRVTTFMGVPTMFAALLNHPDLNKYDLSSLRVCNSGAAPLPVEIKKRWEEVVGVKLNEGYGLSEASPVTHVNPIYGYSKAGSIGVPVADTIAVVVDDDGYILEQGEVGELAIFGPQVMKGYWKMKEETEKVLINGWLLTGDMAVMDEEGFFYIVDRKKDMIVAGGYNIYPREVEEVLYEHPAVAEAAVVGVPDPYRGETVKAFIALKPEYKGKVTEEDLDKHCRERLAAYKVPRIYEFRDELPKSLVGKVLRRVLREEELKKAGKK